MRVEEAVALVGSKVALARLLGITDRAIQKWNGEVPEHRYQQLVGIYHLKLWKPVKGQAFPK